MRAREDFDVVGALWGTVTRYAPGDDQFNLSRAEPRDERGLKLSSIRLDSHLKF